MKSNVVELPIRKKRGCKKGTKRSEATKARMREAQKKRWNAKKFMEEQEQELALEAYHKGNYNTPIKPVEPEPIKKSPDVGTIENPKEYYYEIMEMARARGRKTEIALVTLLHWFKVQHLS